MRREVAKKSSEIVSLQQDLEQSRENLQYSWEKLDSLGKQCEKNIDQQTRITVNIIIFYVSIFCACLFNH